MNVIVERVKEFFPSQLITAELIVDIFAEAVENDIQDISLNEILTFLGIPEKYIDRSDKTLYDLSEYNKEKLRKLTNEILLRFKPDSNS